MTGYGLCGNPDCSCILDRPGVPHFDTYERREVLLCTDCARFVAREGDGRYKPAITCNNQTEGEGE